MLRDSRSKVLSSGESCTLEIPSIISGHRQLLYVRPDINTQEGIRSIRILVVLDLSSQALKNPNATWTNIVTAAI